jgi:hypothetical protein
VRELSLEKNIPVTTKTKAVTFPQGAKQQVIAVPSGTSFTAKNGSGDDITGTFSTSDAPVVRNVPVKCGGTTDVYYDVYVAPANAGLAANSKATITIA